MQPSRRLRTSKRAVFMGPLVLAIMGCTARHPEALAPMAPVAATNIWRLEPGDLIKTRVFRNQDLSAEPIISPNGTAYFPGLGRLVVTGITVDSLEVVLNARYGTLVRDPAVQVTMQREVTLYGQIRAPGVYAVDPGLTLLGLAARAGGQTGTSGQTSGGGLEVILETSDGRRLNLPREARLGTIDLHRTDAIYLADRAFLARNASGIQVSSLVVTSLSAVIGLILVLTR